MKKIILPLIILTITINQLSAQKLKDVLYLKNGSRINGTLMEITDNQYKIRTADGSLFIYNASEVEKYAKESAFYEGRKKKGLGFALEGGFLVGSQSSEYRSPFSFNILGTYSINPRNTFGLGSGVEFIGQNYTPLFIEYKYTTSNNKSAPFLFIRGGGLLHLGKNEKIPDYYYYSSSRSYDGGPSMTVGTGISWSREEMETYLSFGYRYARTSYTETDYQNHVTTYTNSYNRLEIKFGFKF